MKKILSNKLYNTETAKKIGIWDNGYFYNDFKNCTETLYIKKTGEYFLHAEGGPLSKYAQQHGNTSTGGEHIFPFSHSEAEEWAKEHLEADEFMNHFGIISEEDEETIQLNVKISKSAYNLLNKKVSETNKTKATIIEELITK